MPSSPALLSGVLRLTQRPALRRQRDEWASLLFVESWGQPQPVDSDGGQRAKGKCQELRGEGAGLLRPKSPAKTPLVRTSDQLAAFRMSKATLVGEHGWGDCVSPPQ